ncbi:IDEAL domain-containing protein [Bacillus methanolicus]
MEAYYSPEQLEFLINLALDMNDKEWFLELTEKRDLIGQE